MHSSLIVFSVPQLSNKPKQYIYTNFLLNYFLSFNYYKSSTLSTACDIWKANKAAGGGSKYASCPFWIKSWKGDTGLSPQCLFTDYDQEASWYNVVGQFYTVGPFLQGISIITLVFYFVTSSGEYFLSERERRERASRIWKAL